MAIIICHEQHNCETTKGIMVGLIWSLTLLFRIIVFTVFIALFLFLFTFFQTGIIPFSHYITEFCN